MQDFRRSLAVRFRVLSTVPRGLLYTGVVLLGLFLLALVAPNQRKHPVPLSHPRVGTTWPGQGELFARDELRFPAPHTKELVATVPPPLVSGGYRTEMGDVSTGGSEPRMAYGAELAVATKEFVRARSSLEEILERHRGYVAKLRMVGQPAGNMLSATLRIPASEYSSTLGDLKSIGRVEREEESADEITQLQGDLEARLLNAQNREERLERMLQNPPAKGGNTALVERQLAALRAEMQRMQGERQAFENRAVFSTVFFSLREEMVSPAVTWGAQLRTAAVNGLADAASRFSSLLIVVMNYGPSLLLWALLLGLPARFVWRRSRLLSARTT